MIGAILGPLGAKIGFALSGALMIALGVLWLLHGAQGRRLESCRTNHAQFVADVKAQRELARISDAANKAEVEAKQTKIQMEANDAIRNAIAAAVAAVRLRGNAKAGNGGQRGEAMPSPADSARDPAGEDRASVFSPDDLTLCAVNTVKAESWQAWWKAIEAIER